MPYHFRHSAIAVGKSYGSVIHWCWERLHFVSNQVSPILGESGIASSGLRGIIRQPTERDGTAAGKIGADVKAQTNRPARQHTQSRGLQRPVQWASSLSGNLYRLKTLPGPNVPLALSNDRPHAGRGRVTVHTLFLLTEAAASPRRGKESLEFDHR
jgi:hypothetical protein